MSDLKWNLNTIIRFLNIFKAYPCLWDPSNENYNKRDVRDAAMSRLVLHLESDGFGTTYKDQLKCKIKSLKDSYRVELKKVIRSVKSGAGFEDIYKPKLGWFSVADTFWRTTLLGRELSSNLDLSQLMENYEKEEESAKEFEVAKSSCSPTEVLKNHKRSPAKMQPPATPPPSKRSKRNPTMFEKISQLQEVAELRATDREDQHDKFGEFIAAQMREMPPRSVIILQEKIQGLISAERLRLLDTIPPPTSYLSSTPCSSPSLSDDTKEDHVQNEY